MYETLHDSRSVANQIIRRRIMAQKPVTHLQVQKMVYYCHAWMLGIHDQPMVYDAVMAWQYGPVFPNLYHSLKHYGGDPIDRLIDLGALGIGESAYESKQLTIIEQVLNLYGDWTGGQLSVATHADGTPWQQVWSAHKQNIIIPNRLIKTYYEEKARGG